MNSGQRLNLMFIMSLYAVVTIPFAMLVTGGGVGALGGGLFAVVLIASWFFGGGKLADRKLANVWNAIILIFVAGSLAQLFTTDEQVLDVGIRLLLVLTLIKLLSRAGARDELQLYLLSFMMLAAATTVSEDLVFGILFGLYVLVGTFSLAVFHLKDELTLHPRILFGGAELLNKRYIGVLAGISVAILTMSVAIFFVFPRVGLGFFVQQSRGGSSMTGFSESVELGGHGVLRSNPEVVMRVEFPDSPPREENFHWRMIAFDHYDGFRWSRTLDQNKQGLPKRRGKYDTTEAWPVEEPFQRIDVYMEPMETRLLPTLYPTGAISLGSSGVEMPFGPGSGTLRIDPYSGIHHTIQNQLGIPFTLWVGKLSPRSELPKPDVAYLQLPKSMERVAALAQTLTQGKQSNADKAEAIQTYLSTELDYTTDLPVTGSNPIEGFLFDAKRGHCEYFASSMVVMLRTAGVHARLVNGFLGGKWNDVGGYLAVRQGNAHSWVEYWDPALGWVEADPTPSNEVLPANPSLARMREYWDAARLVWMKWVIEYDLGSQIEIAKAAAGMFRPDGLLQNTDSVDPADKSPGFKPSPAVVSSVALFLLMCLGFWRTRVRLRTFTAGQVVAVIMGWSGLGSLLIMFLRGWNLPSAVVGMGAVVIGAVLAVVARVPSSPGARAVQAFDVVQRAATRKGMLRATDEGPASFLDRLADRYPAARAQTRAFKNRYLEARFGTQTGSTDLQTLDELARSVSKALKRAAETGQIEEDDA